MARNPGPIASGLEVYSHDGYYATRRPNPFLMRVAANLAPGDALDLGAGSGASADALRARGWRVTCVDRNPDAIADCRKAGLDARCCDVTDGAAFDGGPFDAICCLYVFQHLTLGQQREVTSRVWSNLVPGGWFVWGGFLDDRPLLPPAELFPEALCRVIHRHPWVGADSSHGMAHEHRGLAIAAQKALLP